MPPKPLEPLAMRLMKGVIAVELLGVFGAYGLFHMMNSSRGVEPSLDETYKRRFPDFRNTMNRRFPSILEVYYQSNEWAGVYGVRERDAEAWSAKRD